MNASEKHDRFIPSRWIRGGHAQTLWRKLAPVSGVVHKRERLELADGDFIDLDWHAGSRVSETNNGITVLILHGLCGCSRSNYVRSLQFRLHHAGYSSVAMNFRGCSGDVNRLARAYHSGVTEDVEEVFKYLSDQIPGEQFAVVGYSLGANVTLKWLGESGVSNKLVKAVAVSTPFNLSYCSQAMLKGLGQYYGRFFLRRLLLDIDRKKEKFRNEGNYQQLEILESLGQLNDLQSLWQFDDRVTAPLHGFYGAEDYYRQCSSLGYLPAIKVPTLLVQSTDDPIIPIMALPDTTKLNAPIQTAISPSGGHVGFASASDRYWLEHRIIRFLDD